MIYQNGQGSNSLFLHTSLRDKRSSFSGFGHKRSQRSCLSVFIMILHDDRLSVVPRLSHHPSKFDHFWQNFELQKRILLWQKLESIWIWFGNKPTIQIILTNQSPASTHPPEAWSKNLVFQFRSWLANKIPYRTVTKMKNSIYKIMWIGCNRCKAF